MASIFFQQSVESSNTLLCEDACLLEGCSGRIFQAIHLPAHIKCIFLLIIHLQFIKITDLVFLNLLYFIKRTAYYRNAKNKIKPDCTSFKTTFDLNISIQSLTKKVRVSPSFEKSQLDEDWETHSLIIKKSINFCFYPVMKAERQISLTHLHLLSPKSDIFSFTGLFSTGLKTLFCRPGLTCNIIRLFIINIILTWPVRELISLLPARSAGKIPSYLLDHWKNLLLFAVRPRARADLYPVGRVSGSGLIAD